MNTKRLSAALLAAVLVVLGSATSAFATFDTYETPSVDLQVSPSELVGGNSFTATATANRDCKNWVITFEGPTTDGSAGGEGETAVTEFGTTEVAETTTGTVTATCTFSTFPDLFPKSGKSAKGATFTESLSASATVTINPAAIVEPPVDPTDPTDPTTDPEVAGPIGGLASTGGPNMWLAIGGALLTLAGAGAVVRSRRANA